MKLNRITWMLLFCVAALAVTLACSISGVPLVSQAEPTATRRATRVARATFTPRPAATETDIPAPTDEPTEVPPTDEPTEEPATDVPTRRPVTVAPKATNPPPPPAATEPPPPTTNPYKYQASIVSCTHAGNAYIKGKVYADKTRTSGLAGIKVIMSDAPDGLVLDSVTTTVDGTYTFTRSGDGPNPGNWYLWVVKSDGSRNSTVSSVIPLDLGHNDDANINTCPNTAAFVDFFLP